MIIIDKWAGLVTNASPYAIPPGAAVTQVNVQCVAPGQLAVRPGLQSVTFSSTISATRPVISAFNYQRSVGGGLVYQDALGIVYSTQSTSGGGGPGFSGVPGVPRQLVATPGDGSVTLDWLEPEFLGGGGVTAYAIQRSADGGATWAFAASATDTIATVSGLTNGTTYVFRVAATNTYGLGDYTAASNSVTPAGAPGSPTGLTATAGNASAVIAWVAPASNGGSAITDYVIQFSGDGGGTWTTFADGTSTATTATVTGLTNGSPYVFRVAAVNALGTSAYAAWMTPVLPIGVPDQVAAPSVTYGNARATLLWSAPPANHQGGITDYLVQQSTDGGTTWVTLNEGTNTDTSLTVQQLSNGTSYRFRVAAVNAVGAGPYSSASDPVIPRTVPGAPTGLVGAAGNAQIELSWTAPSSNGGAAISDYRLEVSVNGGAYTVITRSASTATTYTATGLTNGSTYRYRIAAVNSEGAGASVTSSNLTPQTVPLAPTGVTASVADKQSFVRWTAPSDTGGSVITDYIVQFSSNSGSSWTTFSDGVNTNTQVTVTGLTNGTSYIFRVAAVSAVGTGNYSTPSAAVIPLGPPGAPTSPRITGGSTQAFADWVAPADNGGTPITGYVIQYKSVTATSYTTFGLVGNVLEYTISGLTNGVSYVFRVAAVNAVGTGAYSVDSASVTVGRTPDAVGGLTLVSRRARSTTDTEITFSWTAPNSYGSRITDYLIQYSTNSGTTWTTYADGTSTATSVTVEDLPLIGNVYYFRVAAVSTVGPGAYTAGSASQPWLAAQAAVPPTITSSLTATQSNGRIALTWTSHNDNGADITGARVVYSTNTTFSNNGSWDITNELDLPNKTIYISNCVLSAYPSSSLRFAVLLTNLAGTASFPPATVSNALPGSSYSAGPDGAHSVKRISTVDGNIALDIAWPTQGGCAATRVAAEYSTDAGSTWVAVPRLNTSTAAPYPTTPTSYWAGNNAWLPRSGYDYRITIGPPPASPFRLRTILADNSGVPLSGAPYVTSGDITTADPDDPFWSAVTVLYSGPTDRLFVRQSNGTITATSPGQSRVSGGRWGQYMDALGVNPAGVGVRPSPDPMADWNDGQGIRQVVELWLKFPSAGQTQSQVFSSNFGTLASNTQAVFSLGYQSGSLVIREYRWGDFIANPQVDTATYSNSALADQWVFVTLIPQWNANRMQAFVNGVLVSGSGFVSVSAGNVLVSLSHAVDFGYSAVDSVRVTTGYRWNSDQPVIPSLPFWHPT